MIKNEFDYVARKLEISNEELEFYLTFPKKFYWDYPNQSKIFNLGGKILQKFGSEFSVKR